MGTKEESEEDEDPLSSAEEEGEQEMNEDMQYLLN
eukprot:CAMPEP_0116889048 /NCGR_PEP_ID=MMETSP0463-20121206/24409_1 /TAXON_ID=181622 /ORGANISM="Strombidinopsis sp, Strain SopsisLIS2011" /LENGTH=34 /DNA_ID= /DNA_START= /DNA_END= /DNA_ORIENTATION=